MGMKRMMGIGAILAAVAGVAYLATMGCCQLMGWGRRPVSLAAQLGLTGEQAKSVAELERGYLARKRSSCEALCAKRAQMIQLLEQENPDRVVLTQVVEEIGAEQAALERATVDHLLAVRQHLNPAQRRKLAQAVTEELRTACRMTACGAAGECLVSGAKNR